MPLAGAALRQAETWVFDLDNTLYPAECNLFEQVQRRMGEFIATTFALDAAAAAEKRKYFFHTHGTTLRGLMVEHGIDPADFLSFVHDIDLSGVDAMPALNTALERLPGRKLIFTNGSRRHAERVAGKLGVLDLFEGIFDIQDADYVPKPTPACYDVFLKAHDVAAASAAMFEDMPHNLEAPHALGMTTVLVHSATTYDHPVQHAIRSWQAPPDHVHHMTDDLARFLERLAPNAGQMPTSREP